LACIIRLPVSLEEQERGAALRRAVGVIPERQRSRQVQVVSSYHTCTVPGAPVPGARRRRQPIQGFLSTMNRRDDAHAPIVAPPPAALELLDVHKGFGPEREVLAGVSMRIEAGERVALLGESGIGKSTLLNLAAALDRPDAGTILIAGQPIHDLDEDSAALLRRRDIGFVFQAFHLLQHLTLWQNVAIPLLLNRVPVDEARERALSMLRAVRLHGRGDSQPRELSGGEQQRVALARALVHRPRLVLADEPTGNLDPRTAASALALVGEQVEASGAALLMATHSAQAAAIAQRRLLLTPAGLETIA
jgi:putative ABC transport system ATP-binding protein